MGGNRRYTGGWEERSLEALESSARPDPRAGKGEVGGGRQGRIQDLHQGGA